jgi:hypothetical protein
MQRVAVPLLLGFALLPVAYPQSKSPFLGRWDFSLTRPGGVGSNWMAVKDEGGKLVVYFQPTGGHVVPVDNVTLNGSHLRMVISPANAKGPETTWDLDIAAGKITGVQKHGDQSVSFTGVHAPDLKRREPKAWTAPEPLFNGTNLDGWLPVGNPANANWVVQDGMLVNQEHGVNLKTTRAFTDFKLHYEVSCPPRANSGFFLRGRYEVQIDGGPGDPNAAPPPAAQGRGGRGYSNPPNRSMGSIYGRLAPEVQVTTPADGWDKFDVTLVGRTVTVVRNGVTTIDRKEIEGITGGALDANEGEPGPFYIQGDHTGNVKFRNITISVPKS